MVGAYEPSSIKKVELNMKCRLWRKIVLCCSLFGVVSLSAATLTEHSSLFMPTDSLHVNWLFSGLLSTEGGDELAYFFQLQRDGTQYRTVAAIFDMQTQALIFQDESQAEILQADGYRWSVGNAILRFNPINASWVFGVMTASKQGFNFKMDLLDVETPLIKEDLRPELSVLATQTHALNGHIRVSHMPDEQFVMAKRAWFKQTWITSEQFEPHAIDSILCHWDDGSSLYSIQLPEADATIGAMAGLLNAAGETVPVSQFVSVQQLANGPWDIRVPSSSLHLILSQYTQHSGLVAGFSKDKAAGAFCVLGQDHLGTKVISKPA